MQLKAILTSDWPNKHESENSSLNIIDLINTSSSSYEKTLVDIVNKNGMSSITSLEQLFRRRPAGFDPLKKFVSTLAAINTTDDAQKSQAALNCHINVFAYAFLKAAKNFDFILPLAKPQPPELIQALSQWQTTITALEDFERTGKPLPSGLAINKDDYLAVRAIMTRPSARDERGTLATLLLSGPSCINDICTDLGINQTLAQRILNAFSQIGLIEKYDEDKFSIVENQLPIALFCLRETMGLDPLSMLSLAGDD